MTPREFPRGAVRAFRECLNANPPEGEPHRSRPFGDYLYAADRPAFWARLRDALAEGWTPPNVATVRPETAAQVAEAARLRAEHRSGAEIGRALGVSRERARQLLAIADGKVRPVPVRAEPAAPGWRRRVGMIGGRARVARLGKAGIAAAMDRARAGKRVAKKP